MWPAALTSILSPSPGRAQGACSSGKRPAFRDTDSCQRRTWLWAQETLGPGASREGRLVSHRPPAGGPAGRSRQRQDGPVRLGHRGRRHRSPGGWKKRALCPTGCLSDTPGLRRCKAKHARPTWDVGPGARRGPRAAPRGGRRRVPAADSAQMGRERPRDECA